jgi:hypothetical protein
MLFLFPHLLRVSTSKRYAKMQNQTLTDSSISLTFDDVVPKSTSTRHVAAAAFYHCLGGSHKSRKPLSMSLTTFYLSFSYQGSSSPQPARGIRTCFHRHGLISNNYFAVFLVISYALRSYVSLKISGRSICN